MALEMILIFGLFFGTMYNANEKSRQEKIIKELENDIKVVEKYLHCHRSMKNCK